MEDLKNKIKNCHNDICIFNTKDYVLYEDALKIISLLQLENEKLKRDLKASESVNEQLAEHIEILNEKLNEYENK